MCVIIQGDVSGSTIDKDMHYERIEGMGVRKYLRESCYYRIEYSVANSGRIKEEVISEQCFQPYSYPQRLQEGADETMINTSNLLST